jgi:uncharacterized protein (DUF58 family)
MTNRILADIDAEIEKLIKIRTLLSSNLHTGTASSRPVLVKPSKGKRHHEATIRHLSPAGRARIAEAARKRWAAVRKQERESAA